MKRIERVGEQRRWLFEDGSLPFQMRVMTAGEIGQQRHLHRSMVEYFYVVQGSMGLEINGEHFTMNADDLIVVEPGEAHVVVEKSPDLRLLLLMPPPVPADKVLL